MEHGKPLMEHAFETVYTIGAIYMKLYVNTKT